MTNRKESIDRLYEILRQNMIGKGRQCVLSSLDSLRTNRELDRPGIYFFFDDREKRKRSRAPRIVRVGITKKRGPLKGRLTAHRNATSIFGQQVLRAVAQSARSDKIPHVEKPWKELRRLGIDGPIRELNKQAVEYLGSMRFTWVPVDDPTKRGELERNSIGLLSNFPRREIALPVDPSSKSWLGKFAKPTISKSGLWVVHFVTEKPAGDWLDELESLV